MRAAVGVVCLLAGVACTQRPRLPTAEGRTLESIAETAADDALRAAGLALIHSTGRPDETLLWLRALAVATVDGPPDSKLGALLDCEHIAADKCRYSLTQNSAEAVIVSRLGLDQLRPIRGPLDVERLERYITWSARPESLTVRETAPGRLEIRADLGPYSAILFRRDFDSSWTVQPATITLREDPLGYLVLDPQGESGPLDIVLESGPPAEDDGQPPDPGEFPIIQAEGVVDGTTFAGPPFERGAVLSIFGKGFGAAANEVRVGTVQAEVLYESATQINIRLPAELPEGAHDLTVTTGGRTTEPYPIKVAP